MVTIMPSSASVISALKLIMIGPRTTPAFRPSTSRTPVMNKAGSRSDRSRMWTGFVISPTSSSSGGGAPRIRAGMTDDSQSPANATATTIRNPPPARANGSR